MQTRLPNQRLPFVVVTVIAIVFIYSFARRHFTTDSLEYQGEDFELHRSYADCDEFKDDPNNFTPSQTKRIDKLLERAPSPAKCRTNEELTRSMFELKVPGYGLSSGSSSTSLGDVSLYSIEIPKAGKERVLLYLHSQKDNEYVRLDDFIASEDFGMPDIEIDGNTVKYIGRFDRKVVREIDITN